MKDDSVYIEAEGEDEQMDFFVQWCHRGPLGAKVANVEITKGELKNFKAFDIISSRI